MVCYGNIYLHNIQVGHRFSLIGKSLLDALDVADSTGEVIGVATELRCYVEPVQATKEMYVEGEAAAISEGDTNWAILNRFLFCSTSLWSGTNLCTVNEVRRVIHVLVLLPCICLSLKAFTVINEQLYNKDEIFFRQHGQRVMLAFNLMGQHTISLLKGKVNEIVAIDCLSRSVGDEISTPMEKKYL